MFPFKFRNISDMFHFSFNPCEKVETSMKNMFHLNKTFAAPPIMKVRETSTKHVHETSQRWSACQYWGISPSG
jgi:hypothetical protein